MEPVYRGIEMSAAMAARALGITITYHGLQNIPDRGGAVVVTSSAQLGAGTRLPMPRDAEGKSTGKAFLTVKNSDKPRAVEVARQLALSLGQ